MTEQPIPEPVANLGITRERGYLYYVDKDGNVKRIKKTGKRKSKKNLKKSVFKMFGTMVPRALLDTYVSIGFRKVKKYRNYTGCIIVPLEFVDKKFRVILIPEHYYKEENDNQRTEE